MKNVVAIFFFLLLLTTSLQELFIVGHYYANKSVLTEQFCINKKDISLNCNASCYLSKKLNTQEKHKNNRQAEVLDFKLSQFILPEETSSLATFTQSEEIEHHFSYKVPHVGDFNVVYFRPPKVS